MDRLEKQLPGLLAMAGDSVDEAYRNAQQRGIHPEQRVQAGLQLLERITEPDMMARLNQLIQFTEQLPGMLAMFGDIADERMRQAQADGLDVQAIATVASSVGQALSRAASTPPEPVSLFGIIRAHSDKDRQRGLGFIMNFLKEFGKKIS